MYYLNVKNYEKPTLKYNTGGADGGGGGGGGVFRTRIFRGISKTDVNFSFILYSNRRGKSRRTSAERVRRGYD